MDIGKASEIPTLTNLPNASVDRVASNVEARRQNSAAHADAVQVARTRRSETMVATNEVIAKALGANTRISIARSQDQLIFVYRAIDVDSGEVVQEWPLDRFVEFVNSVQPGAGDELAGLLLDKQA